ncbi:MAG TPA: hypothetical protein VFV38_09515 [Ktedonobacteraceae bacterium]|nr:hypothetical protein [Ktedonobacteraceae bacterium]
MNREPTYLLPIGVIVETMRGLHEPAVLRAPVLTRPGVLEHDAIAQIVVDASGLHTCLITEPGSGKCLYEQGEAFQLLQEYGTLGWTLQPRLSPSLSPLMRPLPDQRASLSLAPAGQIPCRCVELTPRQLQTLPSSQRVVFALVNSTHSVGDLARLLRKSPETILRTLGDLKQQMLIDF